MKITDEAKELKKNLDQAIASSQDQFDFEVLLFFLSV